MSGHLEILSTRHAGEAAEGNSVPAFDVIAEMLSETHNTTDLDTLDERVHTAFALLERDFPRSVQVFFVAMTI